ncbi:YsnF/AvaK domain-containing protein [Clostridium botulinum]|uniref:YsnF/AvaK domain-containing protein n=1 Tax=Clostridium botulinum TaxID=1491 RepID=UPI001A9301A1|nr:YsnF/AvaK domain-containing protein [Clostridium botulinum]MBO0525874.1 YsnF/AvaK domain-containing protein [Clostridium botulinum]MBO0528472.1 YsnF/AvaK domain-containing protein [Clostridium botulinum]MBO0531887.1 YsnF/AvaK domain-containing protein [Clostridium botulinum]MBO0533963.1 YsnF/AvaK domain-containing protein [Clostridium botulinum]MBO0539836.1 YsnF/AvaK domain-containing protein [Clostridium botulinum]
MLNKDVPNIESSQYLAGAIIGGIIGFIISILYKFSILTIPGFVTIFTITSVDPMITGTILGIVVGVIIGMLMPQSKTYEDNIETNLRRMPRDMKMQLREEQMKISKSKIKTGEVSIHKEVLTEEKNITVPVKREELVIENTVCDPQFHDKSEGHTETIRIPIKEERIDIKKKPVDLEDVSVSKDQYEEVKHITETLKKEVPHISINGDAKIVDKEIDKKYRS